MRNESITKHLREFYDSGKCLPVEHEPGSYHERTNGAYTEVSLDMCDAGGEIIVAADLSLVKEQDQ